MADTERPRQHVVLDREHAGANSAAAAAGGVIGSLSPPVEMYRATPDAVVEFTGPNFEVSAWPKSQVDLKQWSKYHHATIKLMEVVEVNKKKIEVGHIYQLESTSSARRIWKKRNIDMPITTDS